MLFSSRTLYPRLRLILRTLVHSGGLRVLIGRLFPRIMLPVRQSKSPTFRRTLPERALCARCFYDIPERLPCFAVLRLLRPADYYQGTPAATHQNKKDILSGELVGLGLQFDVAPTVSETAFR